LIFIVCSVAATVVEIVPQPGAAAGTACGADDAITQSTLTRSVDFRGSRSGQIEVIRPVFRLPTKY